MDSVRQVLQMWDTILDDRFLNVRAKFGGTVENPAVSTVAEHLDVYHVLAHQLSPAEKRDHARRIVDAVLALQVKP